MARPDGGWISGYTTPSLYAARGVWSLRDTFPAQRAGTFPSNLSRYVQLLLHCDGSNGSTTITDSSPQARTGISCVAQAALSTTQRKFGTAALSLPNTYSRVTVPTATAWNLGTADFTIELWVYLTAVTANTGICNIGAANFFGVALFLASNGNLHYYVSSDGASWNIANTVSVGAIAANAWYHVALVRSGTTFSPYLNGVRGTTTSSSAAVFFSNNTLTIGYPLNYTAPGYYDEVRITPGYAMYSGASFTPPTAAFQDV